MQKLFSEKMIEDRLIRDVTLAGAVTYKFASPARRGVPDRLVIVPGGRVVFVELKRPGGKLSALQTHEMARLVSVGADCYVLDSFEAVAAFVREVVHADL